MFRTTGSAFTLVEVLIVVVILGVLAAIVVPQFTRATEDAQAGNLSAQLETLNNQLELYRAQHHSQAPIDLVAGGAVSISTQNFGPWTTMITEGYLRSAPRNPACPKTGVGPTLGDNQYAVVPGNPVNNTGWNFRDTDGDIILDTIEAAYYDELANAVTPNVP